MTVVAQTVRVDPATAEGMLAPRADLVVERADGDGRFVAEVGPFHSYVRTATATPTDDGQVEVAERTEFRLAIPVWGLLYKQGYRHALRRTQDRQHTHEPWWAPPDVFDARAAVVLGLLCSIALVAGYLGTVITQTITFAADEFGNGTTAQGTTLAAVRVGVLGSLVLAASADRLGRRRVLIGCLVGACATAAFGALAPNLWFLGTSQAISRGLSTTVAVLLAIVAAEEVPAGSRAYALSVLTLTGALGAGMCLWLLPLADLDESAWRILYVVPLIGIPAARALARHLPESRRFLTPHRTKGMLAGHGKRLAILCATFFLISMFGAPASQLLNEFLKDERGFSAGRISLFSILTNTPAAAAVVVGGRVADVRGRRWLIMAGVIIGSSLTVWAFQSSGSPMWLLSLGGTMVGALAVPALGVYGPELFPTGARGRANGIIQLISVAGSALGLVVAGALADSRGMGTAMTVLWVGPLLVGLLVWRTYPETAHRELEELNPEDAPPPSAAGFSPLP